MDYQIKRGETTIYTIRPTGELVKAIMGENTVTFQFGSVSYLDIQVGDYVQVFGEIHKLNRLPTITIEKGVYSYVCIFETKAYDLNKTLLMALTARNTFEESTFALVGTLKDFADLIVKNANRNDTGWKVGMVDATETRVLEFNDEKLLQALSKVAVEFGTEFWILDKTIHLTKSGHNSGLEFDYGHNEGLYKITSRPKDGTNILTRLYVKGGTKNLKEGYRDYSNRLMLPLPTDPNETFKPYIDLTDGTGEVIEDAITFDDIYPHRTGTVTYVPLNDIYSFSDAGMDFDLNQYLLPGESAKITFQDGQLGGFTFEIDRDNGGYNDATKTFKLLPLEEDADITLPTELLRPGIGDSYVITDIFMPDSYVTAAEQELYERGLEYYNQNRNQRIMYEVACDPLYFMRAGIFISIGSFVRIKNTPMGIDALVRVVRLTRDVSHKFTYHLDLSETFTIPQIVREYAEQDKLRKFIAREYNPIVVAPPPAPAGPDLTAWKGIMAMWPGTLETIPAGWVECNGENDTINMRGRFPVGVGKISGGIFDRNVGSYGGSETTRLYTWHLPKMTIKFPIGEMKSDMNESGVKGGGFRDLRDGKWRDWESTEFGGNEPHAIIPPFGAVYFIQYKG